jgi:hypothetical protein|tara:strand:+ start:1831 stop:1980 length:150 start_codon:yes stop_codon:yes gene_type:complete
MIETELMNIISTVGFPIAVTFYLLFRFEGKLSANTKVMTDLLIYLKTKR